jgi:hypothetical protein
MVCKRHAQAGRAAGSVPVDYVFVIIQFSPFFQLFFVFLRGQQQQNIFRGYVAANGWKYLFSL